MLVKCLTLLAVEADEILRELRRRGRRRQHALAIDAEERAEIARLAKLARNAGIAKLRIVEAAQISRPSLDDMLRR
jgi:hypothetical protein